MKNPLLAFVLLLLASSLPALMAVWGDTQAHPRVQKILAASISSHHPELIIHTGDLSHKGDQAGYDKYFERSGPLEGITVLPARGNHDDPLELFNAVFGLQKSYYSAVHDSLHLIFLDSNLSLLPGSGQYQWLITELEAQPGLPRIIVLHQPPFSSGYHGGNTEIQLILPALCLKHRVSAVFSGHDHHYERLFHGNTCYFVSGGGGGIQRFSLKPGDPRSQFFKRKYHYLLLNREGDTLHLSAHDLQGKIFDRVEIPLLISR